MRLSIRQIKQDIIKKVKKTLPSKRYQKLYLPKDIKNFTFQRISKTLPSKGYQKHYLPKDIKNITFQRISKTLPSKGYQKLYPKGYQKLYLPKDIKNHSTIDLLYIPDFILKLDVFLQNYFPCNGQNSTHSSQSNLILIFL